MNMPGGGSPDQPAWDDASSGDSAEAAQRELFEFLATSDAAAPPLAADAAPQMDVVPPQDSAPPDFAPSDFAPPDVAQDSDGAPSVSPDRERGPDESDLARSEMYRRLVPARREADAEACERAARSAVEAVDEATRENLRRLEATMSWLQNEVRHLPRAPQIAPVRGVPLVRAHAPLPATSAFDAVIDRSSLARTVQGMTVQPSPPLPIWLCEHEAPIRLPPPRREGGGLWRRLVKFFWACTVAAPIAYVFAITTSPLHKHLADITGLTSAISSLLPTHDAQHAQLHGRDLIAIPPIAATESTATPEAAPVQVASATAGEVAAPDGDHAGAPELAQAPPHQPVIATLDAAETRPQAPPSDEFGTASNPAGRSRSLLPPPLAGEGRGGGRGGEAITEVARSRDSASPSVPSPASGGGYAQDVSALVEQGKAFVDIGDLVAARILFRRAAKAGDAAAAIAMGATYDPVVLAERGVRGVAADLDEARAWYERAKDMGSSEGPRRLEMLANR
jgi:hypothetical protein